MVQGRTFKAGNQPYGYMLFCELQVTLWNQETGGPISSEGRIFHRVGTTAEKVFLLDPASQNSLADVIHNVPSLLDQVE